MTKAETESVDNPLLFEIKNFMAKGMPEAVDLVLKPKDICMVYGVSGSGKSQFFKALADLIEHQGSAYVQQQALEKVCPETWRAQVMYFSAESAWWEDAIELHFETVPSAEQLQKIGLDNTLLKANPDSLSSGEKQRFALLRGLQYQPKVLLLDEITANLDPASEKLVETMVLEYVQQQNAAAMWISHNPEQTARMATKTLKFSKSRVESAFGRIQL